MGPANRGLHVPCTIDPKDSAFDNWKVAQDLLTGILLPTDIEKITSLGPLSQKKDAMTSFL